MALLVAVLVGRPQWMVSSEGRSWRSGIVKAAVEGPVMLRAENIDGDGQAELDVHGGPDMAVLAYSADHYPRWREEIDLPGLDVGGFGENFAISGQDEDSVCVGDVYAVGEAVVQVTKPRGPCANIARRWSRPDLVRLVERTGRHGWYLRVLQEGMVVAGQEVRLLERPHPEWSVSRAREVYIGRRRHPDLAVELLAVPELAADTRRDLELAIARTGA
jgi:MOSC domain-containing protein YiiM